MGGKKQHLFAFQKQRKYTHIVFIFFFNGKVLVACRGENWVLEDTVKGKGLLDVGDVPSKLGGTKTTEVMISINTNSVRNVSKEKSQTTAMEQD